jgi:hypothetical protein
VDALRAFAILGVVLGHWLVTAFVADGSGTSLRVTSPLEAMPELAPLTWALQTLAVFFLVGGYAAGKSLRPGEPWAPRFGRRLARLARPLPVLAAAWLPASSALAWAGLSGETRHKLVELAVSPLWFLGVYLVLTAATPVVAAAWKRFGPWGVALPVAATGAADLGRFALDAAGAWTWITVVTGWLVPFYLGVGWARGTLGSRGDGLVLLGCGTTAAVLLVACAGYPASMVGVPGQEVSNLSPPTLAAVAFGLAQAGLALLLHGPLTRWTRHARVRSAVSAANRNAVTVFLWHQTVLIAVTAGALLASGRLPGLHTAPAEPSWILARLPWLVVCSAALAVLCATAHRLGTPRRRWARPGRGQRPAAPDAVPGGSQPRVSRSNSVFTAARGSGLPWARSGISRT